MIRRVLNNFVSILRDKLLPKRDSDYIYCFKWSGFVKLFTISMLLIFGGIVAYAFITINNPYYGICCAVLAICVTLLGLISAPLAIHIDSAKIEIHGVLDVVTIPFSAIKSVKHISNRSAYGIVPIIATFGFMGYYGLCIDIRGKRLVKIFSSEKKNLIIMECKDGRSYLISATNYDEIVKIISQKIDTKLQVKKI